MKRRSFLASGSMTFAAGATPAWALVPKTSLRAKLATRAEDTHYAETTTYADVRRFLAALDQRGAPIVRGVLAKTKEERDVPYAIASRPIVRTPQEARRLGRPIVYIQAAAHGGELDGKEAVLETLRDLCLSPGKTLLEDLVFIVVPIYNPDGHENFGPQAANRPDQNGPERVGLPENGQGLDLDLDYVKAEAPETRGLLKLLREWNPDVFIDLHTAAGSYQSFGLTYAPSLHPAAFYGGLYARDRLLPKAHDELRDTFGVNTFVCGNFGRSHPMTTPPPATETDEYGWFTRDYRTRYGSNYFGLRGRIALRAESYARDTFERRVFSTRAFLEAVLGQISEKDNEVLENSHLADHWLTGRIPIRGAFPQQPPSLQVLEWEALRLESSANHQPGVPAGYMRSGQYASALMPVFDRYVGTLYVRQPEAYLIPYQFTAPARKLLEMHGIAFDQLTSPRKYKVQQYVLDRVERSAPASGGYREATLAGAWQAPRTYGAKFGDVVIGCTQPLGVLATCLLEPEGADGFFTWNAFGEDLQPGQPVPVLRVLRTIA